MEEQACLVRARSESETSSKLKFGSIGNNMAYSDSTSVREREAASPVRAPSPPAHAQDTDSGELIDSGELGALAQFHEDALRQTGCGIFQLRVALAGGLAAAAGALELAALPFVLPSAEIELCIQRAEKDWLIMISYLGLSLGSAGYGALGSRAGRRRALLSALAVNALFAVIAAFMPTYGTAMCARFCSAIGSGGIIPTAYTYVAEFTPRRRRAAALAPLVVGAALGSLFATSLASAMLPDTGIRTLIEDKQHFSAWHRYLLICTLPIIAALVSLIWTQESPRFLLEVGREADAMAIYKNMHSNNHIKMCGGQAPVAAAPSADHRLGELGRRPPPAPGRGRGLKVLCQASSQLARRAHWAPLLLGGALLGGAALRALLGGAAPAAVLRREAARYEAAKRTVRDVAYERTGYNATLENIEFRNVTFVECTFRDMFLSHVTFRNCSFYDVTFTNIKTSYTSFKGSLFVRSAIIDTDIEVRRDIDPSCVLNASYVRGMVAPCVRDLTFSLRPLHTERLTIGLAELAVAPWAAAPRQLRPVYGLSAICAILSPLFIFADEEWSLYALEAIYAMLITLIVFGATVMIVEAYPASLRCTGLGLIMSVAHLGALAGRSAGAAAPHTALSVAAALLLSSMAAVCARKYERGLPN